MLRKKFNIAKFVNYILERRSLFSVSKEMIADRKKLETKRKVYGRKNICSLLFNAHMV